VQRGVPIGKIPIVSNAGVIVVIRPAGGYRDLLRAYRVQVDGTQVAKIKRGERVEIAVSVGQHDVRAVIDGFGSPTLRVEVPATGGLELTVQPGGSPATGLWQMRRRDTYLALTSSDASATVVPSPRYRTGAGRWIRTLLLALTAFAGIYFFFRGVGDFEHGGSHAAGTKFLLVGLACYLGALGTARLLRRRDRRDQSPS
jgi:hypothetical protein